MTFSECVIECSKNDVFVREFDRLAKSNLSFKGTPIELEIDRVSGRVELDMVKFINFVHEVVWKRCEPG